LVPGWSGETLPPIAPRVAAPDFAPNRRPVILELGRDPGLAPVVQVPVEPEKLFGCLEHDLPGREQLQEIAGGIADEPGELPDGSGLESLLDAAAGLARHEAEGTFSQSIVRHGRLAPETIWELKTQNSKRAASCSSASPLT